MMDELDPTTVAFLTEGGYVSVEDWALDSDFTLDSTTGEWFDDSGNVADIFGAIEGAMEASGHV
jgi:hypothetical protein